MPAHLKERMSHIREFYTGYELLNTHNQDESGFMY